MNLLDLSLAYLDLTTLERRALVRQMRENRATGGEVKVNRLVDEVTKGKTPDEIAELVEAIERWKG